MPKHRKSHRTALIERCENRVLFSAAVAVTSALVPAGATPMLVRKTGDRPDASSPSGQGFSVPQIRGAYGLGPVGAGNITFNGVQGNGTGETIALIDAYNDPNIVNDLATFDTAEGLPAPPSFNVVNQNGQTSPLPSNSAKSGNNDWSIEESLDVEWAHAIAPDASLLLVECSSNLVTGDASAAAYAGVTVVSNSWGSSESSNEVSSEDPSFTTPSGHVGVTFLASAGDSAGEVSYPAESDNVVAVGGTSLTISGDTWEAETAWSSGGGGTSAYEPQPSFQAGTITSTKREDPDVSLDADPNTGVPVYDSFDGSDWVQVGGTSLSSPLMAGMVAIADQGRAAEGLGSMTSLQADTWLYQLSPTNFHDITSGNNGHQATVGYDEASGIGAPIGNILIPDLAGSATITGRVFEDTTGTGVYGSGDTPLAGQTVYLDLNGDGKLDNSEPSTTTNAQGIYTFTDEPAGGKVVLSTAASAGYALTAGGSSQTLSYGATDTANFVYEAVASKLAITQQPAVSTIYGSPLGSVTVTVENSAGATAATNNSTVTLNLSTGTFTGGATSVTATAVDGVATFTNLQVSSAGTYTLTATDGSLTAATSVSFTVGKATPVVSWNAPAGITYGTALTAAQLDATASVPGTFSYTPAAGTVLSSGSQPLSVLFTPTDATDYTTATDSTTITVNVPAAPLSLTGPAFYLQRSGANLDIWDATAPTPSPAEVVPFASVQSISLSGTSQGDNFTTDFSGGSVVPAGGFTINGDNPTGAGLLTIVGTGGTDTIATNGTTTQDATTGTSVTFDGQSINYGSGLLGTVYFTPTGGSQSLNVAGGQITLTPGTGTGITTDTFGNITITAGAELAVPTAATHANRILLRTNSLNLAGAGVSGAGTLDLSDNDMIVTDGNLTAIDSQIAPNYSTAPGGIISSAARSDTTQLTTLGVIENSVNGNTAGAPLFGTTGVQGLFDGVSPPDTAILIKYTYYGDANLDGTVDGSDYSLIDNGSVAHLTGWYNGDFNYDGVIDGSDYSLIDNAFNNQQAALPSAQVATQVAPVSAPVEAPAAGSEAVLAAAITKPTVVRPTAAKITGPAVSTYVPPFATVTATNWPTPALPTATPDGDILDRLNLRKA